MKVMDQLAHSPMDACPANRIVYFVAKRARRVRACTAAGEQMRTLRVLGVRRPVVAAVLSVLGCIHSGGPQTPGLDGSFDFAAVTSGYRVTGRLLVSPEAIVLQADGGVSCKRDADRSLSTGQRVLPPAMPNAQEAITFECLGVGDLDAFKLSFDRQHPAQRSRWTTVSRDQRGAVITRSGTLQVRPRTS